MDHLKKAKELESQGHYNEAIQELQKAFQLNPKNYFIQVEIGNLYALTNNYEEAAGYFRRSHRYFSDNVDIKNGLIFCLNAIGNQYQNEKKLDLAEAAFEEALSIDDMRADILYNAANASFARKNFSKALLLYQKSLAIEKNADTHNNLANTYRNLGRLDKAHQHYQEAFALEKTPYTLVELTHLKQNICAWDDLAMYQSMVAEYVESQKGKISPFTVLSMPNFNPSLQLHTASLWAQQFELPAFSKQHNAKNAKPVIGYLSADFRKHPLYSLIYDVLMAHDNENFIIKLFYSGNEEDSDEYRKFKALPVAFHEVVNHTDLELASLIDSENIDILVDLSGFTKNSRSMIAAMRPARHHVNWLGFAGSMGFYNSRPLFDYIIADNYIIPNGDEKNYAEKVLKIEGCYQPNVACRSEFHPVKKKDYGFADDDFIFASFGQSIKISQQRFDSWLKILNGAPNSKLWLLESNSDCADNLWEYSEKRGIAAERIRFAPKVSFEDHMNRHQVIDLFLDTFPYNAHTSASDALWASCPILTTSGSTFASRVAGSILMSFGCGELICKTEEDYTNKAIYFAHHPAELKKVNIKISERKTSSSLFEPKIFTKRLENIYHSILSG